MKKFLFLIGLAYFCGICRANAAAPQMIGEYDDWVAYYYRDSAGPVCYMASTPKKTRANTAAAATFMRL